MGFAAGSWLQVDDLLNNFRFYWDEHQEPGEGPHQKSRERMEVRVSIPYASTSDDGTHTIYHVVVKVGERSHTLLKRYSAFATLKAELEALYSDQLPYEFPGKTYIRKSVNNSGVTEQRRMILEKLLQDAINDEVNIKWRRSLPFREFLNLPPGTFSSNDVAKERVNAAWSLSVRHDEPILDVTTWIDTVREAKQRLQDARSKVFVEPAEARRELILARSRFESLTKGLELGDSIGDGERKRRTELLNSLKREHGDLESLLSNVDAPQSMSATRKQLFKGRVIGEPQETSRTTRLDNQQLLQLQKQDFKQQDEQLDQLALAMRRQRELGMAINEELQLQNELLDEMDAEVDHVDSKLHYAQKRAGKFT